MAEALGQHSSTGQATFSLSKEFRGKLGSKLELQIPVDAYVAMDYHLDWLQGSLVITHPEVFEGSPFENSDCTVKGTQQDIDLLIAFNNTEGSSHIVLVEAKGYSPWNNNQMKSKVDRFKEIFGDRGDKYRDVKPSLVLMSRRKPQKLVIDWPIWALNVNCEPNCLEFCLPSGRRKVQRCDEIGNSNIDGKYFHCPPA